MRCSSNASFYVYLEKVHHYKDILRDGLDRILEVELRVPFFVSQHAQGWKKDEQCRVMKGGRKMRNR